MKKRYCFWGVLLTLVLTFSYINFCQAHELFYTYLKIYAFKWNNISSGKLQFKVNTQYLSGSKISNNYKVAINGWSTKCPNKFNITYNAALNASTLDLATASKDTWEAWFDWQTGMSYGITFIKTTNDVFINIISGVTIPILESAGSNIKYAQIYFSPYLDEESDLMVKKTAAHEFGHSLGLGHPDKYDKIP